MFYVAMAFFLHSSVLHECKEALSTKYIQPYFSPNTLSLPFSIERIIATTAVLKLILGAHFYMKLCIRQNTQSAGAGRIRKYNVRIVLGRQKKLSATALKYGYTFINLRCKEGDFPTDYHSPARESGLIPATSLALPDAAVR